MSGGYMEPTMVGMSLLALLSIGVALAYRWADKHQKAEQKKENQ